MRLTERIFNLAVFLWQKKKDSSQQAMVRLGLWSGSGFVCSKIRTTAHDCLTSGFKDSGLLC